MNASSPDPVQMLDNALQAATVRRRPDALLLSGGLDSSLLAALWAARGHRPLALTIGLDPTIPCPAHAALPYPCNQDVAYAGRVAAALGLDWHPLVLSVDQALAALDALIVQQRSFDLGQLNNIPLIAGIAVAQRRGAATFATGDDADGLFGGYQFLRTETEWSTYVAGRIPTIDPPARGIGEAAGCAPLFPFLEPEVIAVATTRRYDEVYRSLLASEHPLPPSFVDQLDPALMTADTRPWGKVIVRQVAERWLPREIAWRPKTDLQFGSGMCGLEPILAVRVTPARRAELDATGIAWFNDAHRALFIRSRELGVEIPPPGEGEYACRSCGAGVPIGKRHCVTCGSWPADQDGA
ncbi:MAG TPA: asparagine synthase-related protein [Thermomicrobiales bacterium]|nr:asparagine synthase-related protein [Thermomicrobiales bacterium]